MPGAVRCLCHSTHTQVALGRPAWETERPRSAGVLCEFTHQQPPHSRSDRKWSKCERDGRQFVRSKTNKSSFRIMINLHRWRATQIYRNGRTKWTSVGDWSNFSPKFVNNRERGAVAHCISASVQLFRSPANEPERCTSRPQIAQFK